MCLDYNDVKLALFSRKIRQIVIQNNNAVLFPCLESGLPTTGWKRKYYKTQSRFLRQNEHFFRQIIANFLLQADLPNQSNGVH